MSMASCRYLDEVDLWMACATQNAQRGPPAVGFGARAREARMGDAELVRKALNGDQWAFQELAERHSKAMFLKAIRILGNSHDAEDVVNEPWMRIAMKLTRFDPARKFRPWALRVVRNRAISWLRAAKTRRRGGSMRDASAQSNDVEDKQPSPPDSLLFREEQSRLRRLKKRMRRCLAKLDQPDRELIGWYYFEGETQEQIAERLGLNRAKVSRHLGKARWKLFGCMLL
jgi:RNA polymerase sigma factor CnrH